MIEAAKPEGVWGWAINDLDFDERLLVELRQAGRVVASGRAERLRPDLLEAGIGDGFYGFVINVTSDCYLRPSTAPFAVVGVDRDGAEALGIYVHERRLEHAFTAFRDPWRPAIAGASFLLDNLRDFSPALLARGSDQTMAAYLALRMYEFGDFMWWDEARADPAPTAARYFATIGKATRRALAAGELELLFDMSNEGVDARQDGDAWLRLLHDELDRQGCDPSRCVLITQNRMFEPAYRQWCREAGHVARMRMLTYDYYVARMAFYLEAAALPDALRPPAVAEEGWRHYVCLNFTNRSVRTAFVGWLFGSGLAAHGFVSFFGFENSKKGSWTEPVPDWLPRREVAEAGLVNLRKRGQVLLDLPARETFAIPEFDLGPEDCYARAFFTIVTETDFSAGEIERITEKSIKPLAYGHPVLIVGNPGSLALLRTFGFETFHPAIDESYDDIDDRAERMRRLQSEIERLCAMDHDALLALRERLADRLEHNRRHARRGLAARFRDAIEPTLLARLAERYKPLVTSERSYTASEVDRGADVERM